MKRNASIRNEYAVSELVGGMLLVLVAVIAFASIYMFMFPPEPEDVSNVEIRGYVTLEGFIVLEHVGGEPIESYRIELRYVNNNTLVSPELIINEPWTIGQCKIPSTSITLPTTEDEFHVMVYITSGENEITAFDGILTGRGNVYQPIPFELPMLFSSLMTNTTDEDLICHNYHIKSQIDAKTHIYKWSMNGNSITDLLMPFDTNDSAIAKDYSGNTKNGNVTGPTWEPNGVVGGAYQFDGIDDYISLPYCFDEDNYTDEITVETWINTSEDSVGIASFDKNIFWDLSITNGVIKWATNTNSNSIDIFGITNVNDSKWHYVTATYDSSSGECSIYVDGTLDKNEIIHNPGEELGSGSNTSGFIGQSIGGINPGVWDILTYDDFESGWGNYMDGGRDCNLYYGSTYAHQGNRAANIQDNSGSRSSFYYTDGVDVDSPGYTSIKVDFWFIAHDVENWEDFWVRYYDGNQWQIVADYDSGDEFVNDQFYHETVWINESEYNFPTNMKIRFQCDASHNQDDVYIDQIYVNATTGGTVINNFSGYIDEFRIYNQALSSEQIYQNYLSMINNFTNISVIVSEETNTGETWICEVTPNDSTQDDAITRSNSLIIENYTGGEI